ncbi:MAG: DUF3291 domain-containing protein [Ferruginibacter sp.]
MPVTLTIIRYPNKYIPFALLAMAIFRLPLALNKTISFYKLMGCGKNGTFDKKADLNQWAILACHKKNVQQYQHKNIYGTFIENWLKRYNCETYTFYLEAIEGHGTWDGKKPFDNMPANGKHEGRLAILTRATIRINKLKDFWQHVAPVAKRMKDSEGFIMSVGIGELPLIKQATFSVWESKEAMKKFAYQRNEHTDVIRKTKEQKWYSEDMYTRFAITGSIGTIQGFDPLQRKL